MGSFLKGLLIGIGVSILLAPARGEQTRLMLLKRIQNFMGILPDNIALPQGTQQVADKVKQSAKDIKDNAAQVADKVKQGAKDIKDNTAQAASGLHDTLSSVATQDTSTPLSAIEDMAPEMRDRLEAEGVKSTSQLLKRAGDKVERSDLALQASVSETELREFVYRVDLMQLKGVSEAVAMLLEEAGVNGCKDLRNRNPKHLYPRLVELQENGHIAPEVPTFEQVSTWIEEAKQIAYSGS